jgi:membrane-associated phospholipid phosphatase
MKTRIFIFLGVVFLVIFTLFSRYVRGDGMKSADFAATVKIQEKIDKSTHLRAAAFVDNTMEGATFLASPTVTVIFIIIITFITVIDFNNKKIRWRGLAIPVLFGLLTLGELYGKSVVHHPSPPFVFIKHPVSIFPKDYINEQFSYPSGHTARAVFLAICIIGYRLNAWMNQKKKTGLISLIVLTGFVFLVSVSRIYLGQHWLSDVIGGFLIGSGSGLIAFWVINSGSATKKTSA